MPPPRLVTDRRPTPVRYPKGQESTLDTEIELRNVTLAKTTNLTLVPRLPVTTSATDNYTPVQNENLTLVPITQDRTENLTIERCQEQQKRNS